MKPAVTTTIVNLLASGRIVRWTKQSPTWLPPAAAVDVPYDIWSCADQPGKVAIVAEYAENRIRLQANVLQADGTYRHVDMTPDLSSVSGAVKTAEAPAKDQKTPAIERDHTIIVGSDMRESIPGLRTDIGNDPTAAFHQGKASSFGFVAQDISAKVDHAVLADSRNGDTLVQEQEKTAAEEPHVEEPPAQPVEEPEFEEAAPAEADEPAAAEETYRSRFNEAASQHAWSKALQVLVEEFGADAVTFTARAVSATPDYDAIVAKYNLR